MAARPYLLPPRDDSLNCRFEDDGGPPLKLLRNLQHVADQAVQSAAASGDPLYLFNYEYRNVPIVIKSRY
jgi:hypothetical protein